MYRQSEKNLLNSNISSTCPYNMVNVGLLTAEICWRVWGTPANLNGFCILAALLHGTLVVGISQTVRCWTEGATYIRQGGHHVGHWPTFLVSHVTGLKWSGTQLIALQSLVLSCCHNGLPPPPQPFYGPFSGTTRVSRCQKRTSGLCSAREINRGRHTDRPAGRHCIRTK